jgi:hypothetical protein
MVETGIESEALNRACPVAQAGKKCDREFTFRPGLFVGRDR